MNENKLNLIDKYLKALENNDFNYLIENDKEIVNYENIDYSLIGVYEYLMKFYFFLEKFEEGIKLSELLDLKRVESFKIINYSILCYLAKKDILSSMRYINRSEELNNYKEYFDDEDESYYKMLNAHNVTEENQIVLILCLFVKSHVRCFEMTKDDEIKIAYFELIGLLYEIGYSQSIIKCMTEYGYII